MKKISTILIFLFSITSIDAQRGNWGQPQGPTITGKITGQLMDSVSNQAVEFASIVLMNTKTGKEADGIVSDDRGGFKFSEVKIGTYDVYISFLGYNDKVLRNIELTKKRPDYGLGSIKMVPSSISLETVTVTGEAALIENKIDRIVFNNEKDVEGNIGDATDVLRRVPLLSVDLEGNVSLRGSSNIQILINGKPSGMFSNNVADALKMFPADQIKSVEVITVPSAKYDGEGSAGIINIITKKKQINGFSGSLNNSVGTRNSRTSLSLNMGKGRFGLNGGASAVWSPPRDAFWDFDRIDELSNGELRTLTQDGINDSERLGFRGKFGAYYDINAYNSINSNFSFNGFTFDRNGSFDSRLLDPVAMIDQITERRTSSKTLTNGYDWNTDYTMKFPNSEREFSLGFQLSGNIDDAENTLDQIDLTGNNSSLNIQEVSDNKGRNLEMTFQADYVHPFSKNIKLETGAKGILRNINSDFIFDLYDFDLDEFFRDQTRSDEFDYQQDVYAGYASFNISFLKNYSLIAGTRYERTAISGEFQTEGTEPFENDYYNILPSVIVSRKIGKAGNIRASYNQRIQRPSLRFINPYVNQVDRNNITFGNPDLEPEISHNFEVGFNTFYKGIVINAAPYFRHTTDVIEGYLEIDDLTGISINTFDNIGTDNTFGLSLFTSTTIKKVVSVRGSFEIRQRNLKSEFLNAENSGVEFDGNVGTTISLPKEIKFQFWGLLRNPRVTLQGTRATFWMYNIGAQKQLFGKRGSLGFSVSNLFHRNLNFDSRLEGDGFTQTSLYEYPFRSFNLNFNYRFGRLDFKGKERKNKVKNTDQKNGGDNNY
ncbi:MAG: TonB-dependent receptor [Bacteroidota bacterium]